LGSTTAAGPALAPRRWESMFFAVSWASVAGDIFSAGGTG
jgi:hypothetical protein